MRYRIEYYDYAYESNGVSYILASSYRGAVETFREEFPKESYRIVEVALCYDKDWTKY